MKSSKNKSTVLKFVHLFGDLKFIGNAQRVYEAAMPGAHVYVYLTKDNNPVESHFDPEVVVVLRKDQPNLGESDLIKGADFLCLHWVTLDKMKIAEAFGHLDRVIPFIWGDDLYSNFKALRSRLWMKRTRRLLSSIKSRDLLKTWCKPLMFCRHVKREMRFLTERKYRRFFQQVQYCVPVIPQDGQLLKKVSHADFDILEHNYGSLEIVLRDLYPSFRVDGNDVLLGNSAAHTNNHIDVLDGLDVAGLGNAKVYAPFSYADKPPYADCVEAHGERVLGERFVAMRGFYDREEYYSILSACRYVLFPHYRQQAGGVLRCMIYAGATVFLFKENPFWDYYTELGVKLISMDDFLKSPELRRFKITEAEAEKNREIVDQHFSTQKVVGRSRLMFERILGSKKGQD